MCVCFVFVGFVCLFWLLNQNPKFVLRYSYFSGLISHHFSICSKHSKHIKFFHIPECNLISQATIVFLLLLPPVSLAKKTSGGPLRISLAINFSWNPYLILIISFLSVQIQPSPPYITTPRPCLCTVFAGLSIYLSLFPEIPRRKGFWRIHLCLSLQTNLVELQ